MIKVSLGLAVIAAAAAFGGGSARAYDNAPWCAVYDMGDAGDHWVCEYRSIEDCRPHILAGNRGFCSPSPYYRAPQGRSAPARRHHRY